MNGPILIIEDDKDEHEILREAFTEMQIANPLIFFERCELALDYLFTTSDSPLLILTDINLPGMSGFDFRARINGNEYLRKKSIPFIFLTTSAQKFAVDQAYEMMVQGFFEKPDTMTEVKKTVKLIVDYWLTCKHPNNM